MPPIPLYEGTRPYQTIPFQWSLHAITEDGDLRHREFLADGDGDPRRRFAKRDRGARRVRWPDCCLFGLRTNEAEMNWPGEFPDLGESLNAIIARLVDLLPIVRGAVYLPEFWFSNSIKSVSALLKIFRKHTVEHPFTKLAPGMEEEAGRLVPVGKGVTKEIQPTPIQEAQAEKMGTYRQLQ